MEEFFSSDHHFDHLKIINYCNRPFSSIEEMNHALINKWNKRVSKADKIYYLGDFALSSIDRIKLILDKLNGTKILIKGNHDRHSRKKYVESGFIDVHNFFYLEGFVLSHKPLVDKNTKYIDLWNLCGHVHEKWKIDTNRKILNVGVDVWEFEPISLDQILKEIRTCHE